MERARPAVEIMRWVTALCNGVFVWSKLPKPAREQGRNIQLEGFALLTRRLWKFSVLRKQKKGRIDFYNAAEPISEIFE